MLTWVCRTSSAYDQIFVKGSFKSKFLGYTNSATYVETYIYNLWL